MFLYAKTATQNEMEEFIKTHHYYTTELNYQKAITNFNDFIVNNAWTDFLPSLYRCFVFNKPLPLRIEEDVSPLHQKWENASLRRSDQINRFLGNFNVSCQ